jgi:uroporphyrin-III C-methyltransferase
MMHGNEIAGTAATPDNYASSVSKGKVYLIGAGPGDKELLTIKGLRCLQEAGVVIYDRLVDPEMLDEARPGAIRIFAGKTPHRHTMAQAEINSLLINYASLGYTVARLKGGDPFIFGRGGEEALALADAGIPFEIVPGVTSAIAAPAYAGIPVTHRGASTAVTIITGHEGTTVDWKALAALGGTIVILMGVATLPSITQCLIANGLAPATPAAVIQNGTTNIQRSVSGTVADIATLAAEAGLESPATTVIGAVALFHEKLAWFACTDGGLAACT